MKNGINGIFSIDKPENISAASAINKVKRLIGAGKIGHTGTLDPFATGLLICCMGQATKLAGFFIHGDKQYDGVLELGTETDTQDKTGNVTCRQEYRHLTEEQIHSAFNRLIGKSNQYPPVYSALKHKGVSLYKLARRGTPLQKEPREIEIYGLEILDIRLPEVRFRVDCSAGTYIRALASDIGKALGSVGHLKSLRRIGSCGFSIDDAIDLNSLEKLVGTPELAQKIIRPSDALGHMPAFTADENLAGKVKKGELINVNQIPESILRENKSGYIKILDPHNNLIAILNDQQKNGSYKYYCVFPD